MEELTTSGFGGFGGFRVKDLLGDKFGMYVYENGYGMITMFDFICGCKVGVQYYFGATFDYHF